MTADELVQALDEYLTSEDKADDLCDALEEHRRCDDIVTYLWQIINDLAD